MPNERFTHEARVRVRYAETDQMGIAHHSQFLLWMEVARTDFLREIGYRYKDLEARGIFMAVIGVGCRYRSPAHYDDLLRVKTWIGSITKIKLDFLYEIRKDDGTLVAEGNTLLGCLDHQHKPCRMPPEVQERLKQTMGNDS